MAREITAFPTDPQNRTAAQLLGQDFQVESAESELATGEAREEIIGDTSDTEEGMGFDDGNVRYQTRGEISLDDLGSAVDLTANQLEIGDMNEDDAREDGYIDDEDRADKQKSLAPQP